MSHVLRAYALVADGERGAVIGPAGEVAWLCFPGWDDGPVFASLLGGAGRYVIRPTGRFVWGGQYDEGTLIWRNRWLIGGNVTDCVEALAFPGRPDRAVLVRRVIARQGPAEVSVHLELRHDFGNGRPARLRATAPGIWEGRLGGVHVRWQPTRVVRDVEWSAGAAHVVARLDAGTHVDFTLELSTTGFDDDPADADEVLKATALEWEAVAPSSIGVDLAERDVRHAIAVLRGMTTASGAMVAAATTSLPERADEGRNYDYRYAWIRDQCYTGIAAARATEAADAMVDDAVRFVHEQILADGPKLRPAYRHTGELVPDEQAIDLPGYPGAAEVYVGNPAGGQFQLDIFGEALSLFAAAAARDRMTGDAWRAAEVAVAAIVARWTEPDAGVWEVEPARYTHSRLACVAGLRAIAAHAPGGGSRTTRWLALADAIMADVAANSVHRSGRWQRASDDDRVDAALLLAGIRGALPVDDPRMEATLAAVRQELVVDGYTFRYQVDNAPLGQAEGAFLLCGFWLAQATHLAGDAVAAAHLFERNRAACGPPGIYTEEYDTHERQLRGNFPQAFVHAALVETAFTLNERKR
jgi:GH15 family glucan-1,4-alpha-glucosidase